MLFNIVFIIWLIALSVIVALLYREYIRLRYSREAKEVVSKPKKSFVIPGSGYFTIKEKRKAICNDDNAAYRNELDNKDNPAV